jgi:hypothetical protein
MPSDVVYVFLTVMKEPYRLLKGQRTQYIHPVTEELARWLNSAGWYLQLSDTIGKTEQEHMEETGEAAEKAIRDAFSSVGIGLKRGSGSSMNAKKLNDILQCDCHRVGLRLFSARVVFYILNFSLWIPYCTVRYVLLVCIRKVALRFMLKTHAHLRRSESS